MDNANAGRSNLREPAEPQRHQYKTVIFHLGLHKTGTSYLQKIFSEHPGALKARSVHYPEFVTGNAQAHGGNHSVTIISYDETRPLHDHFSRFINLNSECETLLISGEELSRPFYSRKYIPRIVEAFGEANYKFVFYFRRPDHLLESVYAESVKRKLCGDINGAKYELDFLKITKPFAEAFGKDSVVIRPYNAKLWPGGSLGADFCEAIGAPGLWADIAPAQTNRVNVALNRSQTFMLSLLKSPKAKEKLLEMYKTKPLHLSEEGAKFFRSPEDRKRINGFYLPGLREFGNYYGISDIETFLDLNNFEDDKDWKPFTPHWRIMLSYMAALSDELAP